MENERTICDCKVNIDDSVPGIQKNDLFGAFFEDLNHAADGGLYAELVQNRDFEFSSCDNAEYTPLTAWEKVGNPALVHLQIMKTDPVSDVNPHYLYMEVKETNAGIWNLGYNSGIFLEKGKRYRFSCYAKSKGGENSLLIAALCGKDKKRYGERPLLLTDHWKKYEVILQSDTTDDCGRMALLLPEPGNVFLDFVSLFPMDTFGGNRNGLRADLAGAVADMKPRFLRFPGGCLVHCGSLCAEDRNSMYRWKNTVGPVEKRPAKSSNWKYHQSLGLGYYEYFLFSEEIGAKPIPVIPAGFDPHTQTGADLDNMQEWIEEALDLIEFANGEADSTWGSVRADMGHPEPFGMEYLAIGNEEQGDGFFRRYSIIQKAVREKYPEIKLICSSGPFAAGGDFENGWSWARREKADMVDEHYYQSPEWFIASHHRYDSYFADGPGVFLGEYASKGNEWYHALAEASYMIGLERNADKVKLACYAPLFCNVDYVNWDQANLIWFDNHRMALTANYYVQKLFMNHQGDRQLPCTIETAFKVEDQTSGEDDTRGELVLGGNEAQVCYSDICVTDETGRILLEKAECRLEQKECLSLGKIEERNYRICLSARQMSEEGEGFSICFGRKDPDNQMILSLGGWNRANNTLDEVIHGKASTLSQYTFELQTGRKYDVEIHVQGRKISVKIDGRTFQKIERTSVLAEPVYCSASIETETDDLILKIVNLTEAARRLEISLGKTQKYTSCREFILSGYDRNEKNTLKEPDRIKPGEKVVPVSGACFEYLAEKESFTVLRFTKVSGGTV